MKKNLWMLGVAVAALASCTQNEVLEVSNEKAISFDSFVEKGARATADITKKNLTDFWVFGDKYVLGQTTEDYEDRLFDNELVSKGTDGAWTYASPIRYWQSNKTYRFAAYSDANDSISTYKADRLHRLGYNDRQGNSEPRKSSHWLLHPFVPIHNHTIW